VLLGDSILLVGPPLCLCSVTGNVNALYSIATRLGRLGDCLVGVKIQIRGPSTCKPGRNYIFMSNHVSNLDPPILIPVFRAVAQCCEKSCFAFRVRNGHALGTLCPWTVVSGGRRSERSRRQSRC